MNDSTVQLALRRRFLPLYIAIFCQGFVFWYATEKLFMTSIGFNAATIGLMVALYSAVIILAETPSGILADRWSRRGVLILAALALALSGLIGGLSNSVPIFLISTSFWGIYFALYSGTYDSIIYDTLLEETNLSDRFQHYLGIMKLLDGVALVLGALLGGLIAQFIGLRETYFLTVPIALASMVALFMFREPQLHKAEVASPIKQHIHETLTAVVRKRNLVPILIVLITTAVLTFTIMEFSQVWLIALGVPIFLYGPIDAIILAGYGVGGVTGGRLQFHRKTILVSVLTVTLLSGIGLALSQSLMIIVASLAVMTVTLTALTIVFTKQLHDSLHSKIRAGASSAVSSMGRIFIIPFIFLFGVASERTDIFQAAWMLVALIFVMSYFAIKSYQEKNE